MGENSGIYIIENVVNNKIYVGSSNNFKRRERDHFRKLKFNKHPNLHLQNAYNKYGADNFKFRVLEYVDDLNKLLEREQYWINTLNVMSYGYNINPIADKPPSNKGKHLSPQHRHNIALSNKGKHLSEETKLKISLAKKGRKVTQEFRDTISRVTKGANNPRAKKVRCIKDGKIFGCIKDCTEYYHLCRNTIAEHCKGKRKNQHFEFI